MLDDTTVSYFWLDSPSRLVSVSVRLELITCNSSKCSVILFDGSQARDRPKCEFKTMILLK